MGKPRPKIYNSKTQKNKRNNSHHPLSNNTDEVNNTAGDQPNHSPPSTEKPDGLSDKFDILFKQRVGSLLVAQLNVKKIGRVKRNYLAILLKKLKVDCLAVSEHHISAGDHDMDQLSIKCDYPSLKIAGYKHASKHRDQASGGVAWYWRKDLNVETWDGALLPNDLLEAGRERCWIKVHCKKSMIALGAVYMPTETNDDRNGAKYQQILDVLSLDCNMLNSEKITDFLFGDFNAHVGTSDDHHLGVPNNKSEVGHNGQRLLLWCENQGKILANSQPISNGLWTYQSNNGKSLSVLDYTICNENSLPKVLSHIIDDDREVSSTINTDHNISFSLLDVDHQKVEWEKPEKRLKWDTQNIEKTKYIGTLTAKLTEYKINRVSKGRDSSPAKIISDVTDATNIALKYSTKQICHSPREKEVSGEVLEIITKLKEAEKERSLY